MICSISGSCNGSPNFWINVDLNNVIAFGRSFDASCWSIGMFE